MLLLPKYIFLPFGFILLVGCASTPTPIAEKRFIAPIQVDDKSLLIILPGRGDTIESLEEEGFVEIFHQFYPNIDAVIIGAHLGYYKKNMIEERLIEDIILPAIESGYKKIWIMGISLGGAGALKMFEKHNDKLTGIVLIAPYSGSKKFHNNLTNFVAGRDIDKATKSLKKKRRFTHFGSGY